MWTDHNQQWTTHDAWISFTDKEDFDSIAGNNIETEDDFARACVSVGGQLCPARGEKVQIVAPSGYTTYQWFRKER